MKLFDFEIDIKENREIRILQLTDFQPVDFSQQRFNGRLEGIPITSFGRKERYDYLLKYVEKLINDTKPDLILITGDFVYGEFDDNGENLIDLCEFMDNFGIPWAPIFGNHDNESKKGVEWQCKTLESFSNCLFKRGNVTGNCNYNIAIKQNGELVKVIYMIDSNGCDQAFKYAYLDEYPLYNKGEKIETKAGIFKDQIEYINETSIKIDEKYGTTNKIICTHIAPSIVAEVAFRNGYQSSPDNFNDEKFVLDDRSAKNGDFGEKSEKIVGFDSKELWPILNKNSFTHMFVGHNHINNFSILCDGIRVTFGVKTGIFDYHDKTGGTLITLIGKEHVTINQLFIDK